MRLFSVAVFIAGLLVLTGAAKADDKKSGRNSQATGNFVFDGTTFKIASALAYATTVGDQQQTVVILSDKPLDTAQLKRSLKKNGNDRDFNPSGSTIEFTFDDKGAFRELAIITTDGGMKHVRAESVKDHKATVTIADGSAKGRITVTKELRETLTKHTYRFDVTFDIPLTKP